MSETLKIIIEGIDKATAVLGGIGKAIGGVAVAAGAAAVGGVAALTAGLADCVREASAAEEIDAQLNAVLKNVGATTGVTAEQVNALATALMKTTRFEDDEIKAAETLLLQMKAASKDTLPAMTQATLDLATRMGTDATGAARVLAKALEDPTTAAGLLRRANIDLTDAQQTEIDTLIKGGDTAAAQAIVMDALAASIGGAAEAAGNTFAGKLDRLKNQLGDVKETIGGAVLPILSNLADKLLEVFARPEVQAAIERIAAWLSENLPRAIDAAAAWLSSTLGPALQTAGELIGSLENIIRDIGGAFNEVFVEKGQGTLDYVRELAFEFGATKEQVAQVEAFFRESVIPIIEGMGRAWDSARAAVSEFWSGVRPHFDALAERFNQFKEDILPKLQTAWDKLREVFDKVSEALGGGDGGGGTLKALGDLVGKLLEWNLDALILMVTGALDTFIIVIEGVGRAIDGVKDAIEWFKQAWDDLKDAELPDWLTPGSPTPFELGLRGIGEAAAELSGLQLPALTAAFGGVAGSTSNTVQNHYNLTVNTQATAPTVRQDFYMMKALAGA